MQINIRDLQNSLISNFSYHDSIIKEIKYNKNNITFVLIDGWMNDQINELTFIDAKTNSNCILDNREIYQLDGLVNFDKKDWQMSFLVWADKGVLERVCIRAKNIIAKKFELNENAQKELNKINNEIYNAVISEFIINTIFNGSSKLTKAKEQLLSNLNNYILTEEEDLNETINNKF